MIYDKLQLWLQIVTYKLWLIIYEAWDRKGLSVTETFFLIKLDPSKNVNFSRKSFKMIDLTVIVMLLSITYWHFYVGDFTMVTDLRCWWQNHYFGDFFRYVGDFLNVLNRSPTSQTCHQHIWSLTSVTNINVIPTSRLSLRSCLGSYMWSLTF